MVAHAYKLIIALLLTLCLGTAAHADDTQDALVEQGVAAYDDGDYQRAKDILLPLAEAGHPQAMHIIGRLHEGLGGVFPKDPKTECDWYERAAHLGFIRSMYNLSICYNHGVGRSKDQEQMLVWRIKSANLGHIPSMINLAALDPNEGEEYLHWMLMAQDHGSSWAKVDLWLQGYKDETQMTVLDFVCVVWRTAIFDEGFRACD